HHPALQGALEVALLHRAQGMVDQDQVGTGGLGRGLDLLQLAAADERGRIRAIDARGQRGRYRRAGRPGQVGELFQHVFRWRSARMGLDQQRVFTLSGSFEQSMLPGAHAPSSPSSPPSDGCCTYPPPGPTRTLRDGTTVEMACL